MQQINTINIVEKLPFISDRLTSLTVTFLYPTEEKIRNLSDRFSNDLLRKAIPDGSNALILPKTPWSSQWFNCHHFSLVDITSFPKKHCVNAFHELLLSETCPSTHCSILCMKHCCTPLSRLLFDFLSNPNHAGSQIAKEAPRLHDKYIESVLWVCVMLKIIRSIYFSTQSIFHHKKHFRVYVRNSCFFRAERVLNCLRT